MRYYECSISYSKEAIPSLKFRGVTTRNYELSYGVLLNTPKKKILRDFVELKVNYCERITCLIK